MAHKPQTQVMACLWVAALGACGSGSGNDAPIPVSNLSARVLEGVCSRAVRCGEFPDKASCQESIQPQLNQLMADVTAGKSVYDGAAAADCVKAIANPNGIGSCSRSEQFSAAPPASCDNVFKGTAIEGAACVVDTQCVSAFCVVPDCASAMCCLGTCAATPPAPSALGGACLELTQDCVVGTFCKSGPSGPVCVAATPVGQPCASLTECEAGTFCNVNPSSPMTCAKLPLQGEACGDFDCDAADNVCDPVTNKCVHVANVGEACVGDSGCAVFARCDVATMKCVAKSKAGNPCVTSDDCLGDLGCSAGTCSLLPPRAACP